MPHGGRKVSRDDAQRVMALTERGWPAWKIGQSLGISRPTIYRLRKVHRDGVDGLTQTIPAPKKKHELSPEALATVSEVSADCFERFYNRYNSEYSLPPHCKEFVERALGRKQVVINIPFGHMKSSVFSVWVPLWLVAMNPDIQILLVSKAQALSVEFMRSIAFEMEENKKLLEDFGKFKPNAEGGSWSPATGKMEVAGRNRTLSHGGTLRGFGAGQQITGFRADLIVADDLSDLENSRTEEARKELARWFDVVLRSRLRPGGQIWAVGTRFHPEDIFATLISKTVTRDQDSKPLYQHVNFPALKEPGSDPPIPCNDFTRGEALWPAVWPPDRLLEEVYEAIGSSEWQQSYQQVPLSDTDALAWPEWIYGTDELATPDRRGCLDMTRIIGQGVKGAVRVISVDPSPTKFVGIIGADVVELADGNREIVILEIVNEKMLQRDLIGCLDRMVEEHGPVRHLIFEVNSFARWFTQDLDFDAWAKSHSIRIHPHTTHRNKTDPENGLESLSREFEFGRIRFPWAEIKSKTMSQMLIKEATQYTRLYKGRTDLLMALWFIHFNRKRLKGPRREVAGISSMLPPRLRGGFNRYTRKGAA